MNPLNFYKNPKDLNYEKDVDEVGRDLIQAINETDYLRTTMYCSGHFEDEQKYPWKEAEMTLCLVSLNDYEAYMRLNKAVNKLRDEFGFSNVRGGFLYLYFDPEDNKAYQLSELLVDYETKEGRQKTINILKETLL